MTAEPLATPTRPAVRTALRDRAFVVHYLQMLVAMVAGMMLLGPLTSLVGHGAGVEVHALLMATSMTLGMTAWMAWRRHSWPAVVEMGLVMYLSFAVLFPPYWLGLLPAGAMIVAGHVLMLPAMALAMLFRREEYCAHHRA